MNKKNSYDNNDYYNKNNNNYYNNNNIDLNNNEDDNSIDNDIYDINKCDINDIGDINDIRNINDSFEIDIPIKKINVPFKKILFVCLLILVSLIIFVFIFSNLLYLSRFTLFYQKRVCKLISYSIEYDLKTDKLRFFQKLKLVSMDDYNENVNNFQNNKFKKTKNTINNNGINNNTNNIGNINHNNNKNINYNNNKNINNNDNNSIDKINNNSDNNSIDKINNNSINNNNISINNSINNNNINNNDSNLIFEICDNIECLFNIKKSDAKFYIELFEDSFKYCYYRSPYFTFFYFFFSSFSFPILYIDSSLNRNNNLSRINLLILSFLLGIFCLLVYYFFVSLLLKCKRKTVIKF